MKKYRLKIAYEGTHYCGWQIQPTGPTIQEAVETVIAKVLQEEVALHGAGRTDSGVHALGQVAHFISTKEIDEKKLLLSLNALLPKDIRILELTKAPKHFHARYSAIGKTYHYKMLYGTRDPFCRRDHLYLPYPIDVERLKKATSFFVGTNDFTTFANDAAQGSAAKNPVRTIKRLDLVVEEGRCRLEFEGNGFLYKMVRNITGTLLEVASGKRPLTDIPLLFEAKDRRKAGPAARAHGLTLVKVDYL